MSKRKNRRKEYSPIEAIITSAEGGMGIACNKASVGHQVILFTPRALRPSDMSYHRKGVYALCEADIYTEEGLDQAMHIISNQVFDTVIFGTYREDEALEEDWEMVRQWDQTQITILKEAAYAGIILGGHLHHM